MNWTLGMRSVCALLGASATVAWAGPVSREFGPNLVTNGGFEASTTLAGSGWTVSGAYSLEGYDFLVDTTASDAHGGSRSFAGGAVGGLGFLSQTLSTVSGTHYDIHLWLANLSGFGDGTAIQVLWNGQQVYAATDLLQSGYTEIVIDPVAVGSTSLLSIGLQDDSFFLNLDDVSVRAVPEPATIGLLAGGLATIGMLRRRTAKPRAVA